MKLTSLIISVAVCYSFSACFARENFSPWPRRPAELEQARRLHYDRKDDEALRVLAPFIRKRGSAGHEARQLTGTINMRRYLSTKHPRMRIHTVRRGENLDRIASDYKSSTDLITYVNRLLNPSDLKAGQELYVVPADLRAELRLVDHEVSLWDGNTLVASYDIQCSPELLKGENEEATLAERTGELNGRRIPRVSAFFAGANRILRLSDGLVLTGVGQSVPSGTYVQLKPKDLNEFSMLLRKGAQFSVIRK